MLKAPISGNKPIVTPMGTRHIFGNTYRFTMVIIMTLVAKPKPHMKYLVILFSLERMFAPRFNPTTVDSSANTFMEAETMLPLLTIIPIPATMLVVIADGNPYMKRLMITGIPVKSNLRLGYHGNGIFSPEYFKV